METLFTIVINTLLLATLWWLYFFCYKQYRADKTRQELFAIRDDLFMAAEAGELDFNSPAYGRTRMLLNGMIRYTHRMSLIQMVSILYARTTREGVANSEKYIKEYEKAISELGFHEKRLIVNARTKMHETVIKHIMLNSVVVFLIAITISAAKLSLDLWKHFAHGKKSRRLWAPIEAEVEAHLLRQAKTAA